MESGSEGFRTNMASSTTQWKDGWTATMTTLSVDEWKLKYETMKDVVRSALGEKVLETLVSVTERKIKEKTQQ